MTFLYRFASVGKVMFFSCTVVSPMPSFACLTLSACKATERANSFVIPSSPNRCLKWIQSLAAQSGPHWKVASPARRCPMRYYTLIAEVVAVFAHQKGSHLSDGVARQAHPPIERRPLLALSMGACELIGRAGAEDLTDGQAGFLNRSVCA
jgi:hypothetical protein